MKKNSHFMKSNTNPNIICLVKHVYTYLYFKIKISDSIKRLIAEGRRLRSPTDKKNVCKNSSEKF